MLADYNEIDIYDLLGEVLILVLLEYARRLLKLMPTNMKIKS